MQSGAGGGRYRRAPSNTSKYLHTSQSDRAHHFHHTYIHTHIYCTLSKRYNAIQIIARRSEYVYAMTATRSFNLGRRAEMNRERRYTQTRTGPTSIRSHLSRALRVEIGFSLNLIHSLHTRLHRHNFIIF